jgi:signal transduction histidine kinase
VDDAEQFLRSLPLFSTFSDESVDQVLANSTIRTYAPRETIIQSGLSGSFLGIILEGEAEVVKEDQPGQRRVAGKREKGAYIGEMSLMTGELTSADVIACEECQIAVIPADVFSETIANNPDSVRYLARLMGQRLMQETSDMHQQMQLSEETTHVVSHELKSPLAGIATLAMAILEPKIPMEQKERFLQRIIARAEGARVMIEEYLTLSAVSAGQMNIVPEKVRLYGEVIEKVLDHQKEIIIKKEMTPRIDVPKELEVICDPRYIQIVYNNLVSNAAKYGTRGTEIYLGHIKPQNDYHRFNVANAGEWIEEGDRKRIFEKYVRLGRRGTGIGLHTATEIIRKHGGDIWVEPCYLAEGKCIAAKSMTEKAAMTAGLKGNSFVFTIPAI